MTEHPNATLLDAFAIGVGDDAVTRAHVDGCPECAAYVADLRAGADRFARDEAPRAAAFVAAVRLREQRSGPRVNVGRWAGGAVSILALAAGLVLFVRSRPAPDVTGRVDPTTETRPTRFKGGMQVAVVVEHLGVQSRQAGPLALEPGDRIRLEIALDHDARVEAGVLTDDGEWAPLEPPLSLQPGTHYSEQSIAFTDSVPSGQVVVGDAEAVGRARETHDFAGLTTIRLGPKAR